MVFVIKIRQLRKQHNLTMKQFGEIFGIAESTVSLYENGKRQADYDTLKKIAEYFNVSIDYLLGMSEKKESDEEKAVKVYVYGKIPAGIPFEAIEDVIDVEEIPKDMTRGGKEYFALKISGNSMNPNYIDGDIVIFEKLCNCENNDDCAVMVNGNDATFKRVEKKENGITLKPLNPEYETMFFTNEEIESLPVRILGIARELRRKKLK